MTESPSSNDPFHSTHWSLVLRAAEPADAGGREALAELCRIYWQPLYAYARRRTESIEDAQDVTQSFFAELIEKRYVQVADPDRGRFRAFLLTAFKHFLGKHWQRRNALKRGGGRTVLSLDFARAEEQLQWELKRQQTAEQIFERRWAHTLLERVFEALAADYRARRTSDPSTVPFEQLQKFLLGDTEGETYAAVAARHQATPGAVKMTVHRLREKFRQLLRLEIMQTVASPAEVDDEIRSLMKILEE